MRGSFNGKYTGWHRLNLRRSRLLQPRWVVLTSVNPPTQQVKTLCYLNGWHTVVVADLKTPKNWNVPSRSSQKSHNSGSVCSRCAAIYIYMRATFVQIRRQFGMSPTSLVDASPVLNLKKNCTFQTQVPNSSCIFLGVELQRKLGYAIHDIVPYKRYERKNIGYLFAIQHGAKLILDTDDDNVQVFGNKPLVLPERQCTARLADTQNVWNIYEHYGRPDLWRRGYPLEAIQRNERALEYGPALGGLRKNRGWCNLIMRITRRYNITLRSAQVSLV